MHHTTADPVERRRSARSRRAWTSICRMASRTPCCRAPWRRARSRRRRSTTAVRRMLRLKFIAGLFEQPYADAKQAAAITDNAEARALALEAARKSVVLLKNDGVLPLRVGSAEDARSHRPECSARRPRRLFERAHSRGHRARRHQGEAGRAGSGRERRRRAADRQRRLVRGRSRAGGPAAQPRAHPGSRAGRARRRRDRARDRRQQRHEPRSLGQTTISATARSSA